MFKLTWEPDLKDMRSWSGQTKYSSAKIDPPRPPMYDYSRLFRAGIRNIAMYSY